MKVNRILLAVLLTVMPWGAMECSGQAGTEQAFLGAIGKAGGMGAASAADSGFFASGTRAINEGRWSDAVSIFKKVSEEHGEHADGALYWTAYAENKQGQAGHALDTCGQLRREYPRSGWIDECGALEIEIRSRSGQPVQQNPGQDEDMKLLALNSLMRQDEQRALAQIQEILNGDSPERLKERAVFILTQGRSKQAQDLLKEIALGKFNPAHPNPALQTKATGLLRGLPGDASRATHPATANRNQAITLDVVVTDKSGAPVADLQPGDFTLFDNKQPQPLGSVQAANGMKAQADPPVEVFLVVDDINIPFEARARQRQELVDFFNENGKELALPTSLVVLTDKTVQEQNRPTRDGNALLPVLEASYSGFRQVEGYQGLDGALLREEDSLKALNLFALQQSKRPGRKLFIWLGSGWNVTSNPMSFGGPKKLQNIYAYISSLSTALREARITLYSVVPLSGVARGDTLMQYVKGVSDPKHADLGDLSLPVLATQTGGQFLTGSSDLPALIDRCIADARAYYQLTFIPPPASHPDEYHGIEVVVDKPGLKARTRAGYYSQPSARGVQSSPEASLEKPAD